MTASISPSSADMSLRLADWLDLARDMVAVGEMLANSVSADRGKPHEVVLLAILARTLGHMKGLEVLVRAERVVEARIIVRSVLENLFLAAAIAKDGPGTLRDLKADHNASRRKRGELIAQNPRTFSSEQATRVRASLREIAKGRTLFASEAAKGTPVSDARLLYAQLSADSAHPSFDALERHVVADNGGLKHLELYPAFDQVEACETIQYSCMALLGTLATIRETLGITDKVREIEVLGSAYQALLAQG